MTEPTPEWAETTPSTEGIHKKPPRRGGEFTFPFTPQQLFEIGAELIEQFLRRVVNAVAGVFIPGVDAFSQLQDWANNIGEFIGNIFDTIVDALNDLLGGVFGGFDLGDLPTPGEVWEHVITTLMNPLGVIEDLFSRNLIRDLIIGIGNVLDDIPFIGDNLEDMLLRMFNVRKKNDRNTDAIYQGFTGDETENNTTDAAKGAATAASSTIAAHTAALARLESGPPVVATFDFSQEPNASSLPSPWNVTYTGDVSIGTWGVYNGAAQFVGGPPGGVNIGYNRTARGIFSTDQSPGDRQRVGAVFSSIPQEQNGSIGHNILICRSDSTAGNYVAVDFTHNQIQLYYVVGGSKTIWSTTSFIFKANNAYYLECGVGLFDRQYRVVNGDGTILLSYTEIGTASMMGSSYRYAGAGAINQYYDDIFRLPEYGKAARMDLWIFQEGV